MKDIDLAFFLEQVKALRRALKDVPSGLDKNERFRRVSTFVGRGRSKKDCYEKYKVCTHKKNGASHTVISPLLIVPKGDDVQVYITAAVPRPTHDELAVVSMASDCSSAVFVALD